MTTLPALFGEPAAVYNLFVACTQHVLNACGRTLQTLMTQQKRGAQQVRIIGGKFKGRKLRFNGGASLRPTLSRTRETLFNWLRPDIEGTRCLDAFAGSGALGFEALSQGAAEVVFAEKNPRTVRSLEAAVRSLDCQETAKVVRGDVLTYLKHCDEPYDIVFVDPPYGQPELLDKTLDLLLEKRLVRGYVYIEARSLDRLEQIQNHGWRVVKQTRSADAQAALIELKTFAADPTRR